jgi:Trk K+ transport system NAD-binding subunit
MAILFSAVTDYVLTARIMQLGGKHHVPERGHVVVVGVGQVGYRTIEELVRLKASVVAIDRNEEGEFQSAVRSRAHLIVGDAREEETLQRAGVQHAKAVVVLTGSDAVNLGIGLTVKEVNPLVRVVLSIFDADFAEKVRSIREVDAALSCPVLAAPSFVGAALYENAVASFKLGTKFFTLCRDPDGKISLGAEKLSLEVRDLPVP